MKRLEILKYILVWNVFEQTFIAALDQNDKTLASWCLNALKKQFPESLRVKRLEGMQFVGVSTCIVVVLNPTKSVGTIGRL